MRSAWFAAIVIVAATTAAMAADDGWETYRFPKLGIEIQLPGEVRIEEFNHGDGWGGFAANIRLLPGRSKARIAINVIVKHGILSVDELRSYISGWSGMKWRDITLGPFVVGEKRARFLRKGWQRLKFPKNLQRKKKAAIKASRVLYGTSKRRSYAIFLSDIDTSDMPRGDREE